MSDPRRANKFFMFPEFIQELIDIAVKDNVTVERFSYDPNSVNRYAVQFEVRLISVDGAKLPALRRTSVQRVRPGRKAARDDGQRKGSKQS